MNNNNRVRLVHFLDTESNLEKAEIEISYSVEFTIKTYSNSGCL